MINITKAWPSPLERLRRGSVSILFIWKEKRHTFSSRSWENAVAACCEKQHRGRFWKANEEELKALMRCVCLSTTYIRILADCQHWQIGLWSLAPLSAVHPAMSLWLVYGPLQLSERITPLLLLLIPKFQYYRPGTGLVALQMLLASYSHYAWSVLVEADGHWNPKDHRLLNSTKRASGRQAAGSGNHQHCSSLTGWLPLSSDSMAMDTWLRIMKCVA